MADMTDAFPALTEMPSPQYVMSADGRRIATYLWGEEDAPTVLAVHGFASSCRDNWVSTGWVRDLTRAGFRVLGVDQRGHGASDKPHDPGEYTMDALVGDLVTVLEHHIPGLRDQLDDSVFNFAVNDEMLLHHARTRVLHDGDTVEIVPTISGG